MAESRKITVKVSPGPVHYLAIDVTDTVDSKAFGACLQERGWINLLSYLQPAADQKPSVSGQLVDPSHPYFAIHELHASRGGTTYAVPVACPNGLDGVGQQANKTQDQLKRSREFAGQLLLHPRMVHTAGGPCALVGESRGSGSLVATADLVYVSSHGYFCGLMTTESIEESFFSVPKAAAQHSGFRGPLWIVLSQCSTLNPAVLPCWGTLLMNSSPGVRGILGYQAQSPKPAATVRIIEKFMKMVNDVGHPSSLLEAWKACNTGIKWTAIVHRDAVDDRLADIAKFRKAPLKPVALSDYRFYSSLSTESDSLALGHAPFRLRLQSLVPQAHVVLAPAGTEPEMNAEDGTSGSRPDNRQNGDVFTDVSAAQMENDDIAELHDLSHYRICVQRSGTAQIRELRLDLVNIRADYPAQFIWSQLFEKLYLHDGPNKITEISPPHSRQLQLRLSEDADSVILQMETRDLVKTVSSLGHNYIWFSVTIVTSSGARHHHEFKEMGWRL